MSAEPFPRRVGRLSREDVVMWLCVGEPQIDIARDAGVTRARISQIKRQIGLPMRVRSLGLQYPFADVEAVIDLMLTRRKRPFVRSVLASAGGRSPAEIARAHGVTRGAVRNLLAQARKAETFLSNWPQGLKAPAGFLSRRGPALGVSSLDCRRRPASAALSGL